MKISEEMVKQVILEVLQQMQKDGPVRLARKNRLPPSPSRNSGRQNVGPTGTRWSSDCRRHLARR